MYSPAVSVIEPSRVSCCDEYVAFPFSFQCVRFAAKPTTKDIMEIESGGFLGKLPVLWSNLSLVEGSPDGPESVIV